MTDLDHLLASLGDMPLDPRLAGIDQAVFARLEAARQPVISRVGLGAVAALAMLVGTMATALPSRPVYPGSPYPLGIPRDLVPSTLLGEV